MTKQLLYSCLCIYTLLSKYVKHTKLFHSIKFLFIKKYLIHSKELSLEQKTLSAKIYHNFLVIMTNYYLLIHFGVTLLDLNNHIPQTSRLWTYDEVKL